MKVSRFKWIPEKRDYVREYLSDPAKRMKAKSSLKARGYTVADLEEVIQGNTAKVTLCL